MSRADGILHTKGLAERIVDIGPFLLYFLAITFANRPGNFGR